MYRCQGKVNNMHGTGAESRQAFDERLVEKRSRAKRRFKCRGKEDKRPKSSSISHNTTTWHSHAEIDMEHILDHSKVPFAL